MILAIPTNDISGLHAAVFGHFGSAPYFAIYDGQKHTVTFINNANSEPAHGQCQPTDKLTAASVNMVVCKGMGRRAISKLNDLGIKVYYAADALVVDDVIRKLNNNELPELSIENLCVGHGCH